MRSVCIICECFMRCMYLLAYLITILLKTEFTDIDKANFVGEAMFVSKFENVFSLNYNLSEIIWKMKTLSFLVIGQLYFSPDLFRVSPASEAGVVCGEAIVLD